MPQRQKRSVDPDLTRKGFLSHPGSLATVAAAILFGLYVFNVGGTATFLDTLFGNVNKSVQSENDVVVNFTIGAVPYIIGGFAFLFILFFLMWLRKKVRSMQRRMRFNKRRSLDVQEFTQLAKQHGISAKVAMQTYRILKPSYEGNMRATLDDDLRDHLHKKDADVEVLHQRILHYTDRKKPVGGAPIENIRTVGDLMRAVEKSPTHSLTHSMARRIRGEKSDPLRKALPKAKDMGETRMVVPLHKRIQQMEKEAAASTAAKPSEPARPSTPKSSPASSAPASSRDSGEIVQPLHKRF